jgi:actin-related protein 6
MPKTLIIDNGSYEIKVGTSNTPIESLPRVQNSISRTRDKRLLIGNQVNTVNDISGMIFKRPFEKGHLISWETEKLLWEYCFNCEDFKLNIDPTEHDLIMTETPFMLPQLSQNSDQIVFEEFQFQSLYKAPTGSFLPWNFQKNEDLYEPKVKNDISTVKDFADYQLIIDSGFNATWVIPVVKGMVYWSGVRKLEIGGRFLSGVMREKVSFRHYNVTDETILVNNIKESSCFVTMDYNRSLRNIKKHAKENVIEYVLPDFNTTTHGYVLTPELRAKYRPQEQQILKLYDERFSVPETIFHPEIVEVMNKPGIVETIVDSIYSVPEIIRPLLVSNIAVIGGNFNLENFERRLLAELKIVLPVEWEVRIAKPQNPSTYGWECAQLFSQNDRYKDVKVTRAEYDEHGPQWVQRRFGFQV